jgi:hypothetical protein
MRGVSGTTLRAHTPGPRWRWCRLPQPADTQVCASKFWFNYRHTVNALSVYGLVRASGVPDSRILLLLADDAGCNARNPDPACAFANDDRTGNVCVARGVRATRHWSLRVCVCVCVCACV